MTTDLCRQTPSALGEIVETYQKRGEEYAKILVKHFHLELPLVVLEDAHLGDQIQMDMEVAVKSARLLDSPGFHDERSRDDRCSTPCASEPKPF
jgi:hypothetical protein